MSIPQGTFAVSEAVELAVVTRGDFDESRHSGTAIVLSADGDTLVSLGNTERTFLGRSSLKPLQSLAMHQAGLKLANPQQQAVSFASHNGTAAHVETVTEILQAGGLTRDALLCPPAMPSDTESLNRAIRDGEPAQSVFHNCSGKHSAMLRTCLVNDWPIENYTAPDHPLQQHCLLYTSPSPRDRG